MSVPPRVMGTSLLISPSMKDCLRCGMGFLLKDGVLLGSFVVQWWTM